MKIEEQVLTIEQAKHLQELGLDMSDAALCWSDAFSASGNCCNILFYAKGKMKEFQNIPTYTLQEVVDKLPNKIYLAWLYIVKYENKLFYAEDYYEDDLNALSCFEGDTLLEAAYKMLCWAVENGYLKEDKK